MWHYPNINPIAVQLGPIKVHWYGLMYLFSFLIGWGLLCYRARKQNSSWTIEQISDLILYTAVGVLVGGRLGYMLFYDLSGWIQRPLSVFEIWDGGMSFHGGALGVLVSTALFAKKVGKSIWDVTDFIVPIVPIGLGLGRLGNFINGELWGRVTQVPWGMVFPRAGSLPRHPSQLYESFLEGLVLFLLLWFFSSKPRPRFAVSSVFLLGYGCMRFFCEFFRQPDPQWGFIAFGWLTMGQLLSLPMILIGGYALVRVYSKN